MDNIQFDFLDIEIPDFDPDFFCNWILLVAQREDIVLGEIQYIFCSDNELLKINNKALGHNYFTDIVTFNYNEENSCSGDLFISYDRVKDNAAVYGNNNVFDELCRVMVHGVLHLIGYDDKTEDDKIVMRKMEDLYLSMRGDVSRETL
ncbi:MAG: rRNA maturation RNase YbeY [Crocinitomicaceae bacterium]|nr:rRNA maturation RNase YbeY [Crocinitomicaceae bacterium]